MQHVIPEVSKTTIHEAVTEKLGYRKLCACWVPKMLTDDHNTKRMDSALKLLPRYAQKGDEFLDTIVTGDKTWVFHYTPESKQQPLQWRHTQEEVMTWYKGQAADFYGSGYRSWFEDLINVWTMPATILKNKVM
jgi:hypothetical protein